MFDTTHLENVKRPGMIFRRSAAYWSFCGENDVKSVGTLVPLVQNSVAFQLPRARKAQVWGDMLWHGSLNQMPDSPSQTSVVNWKGAVGVKAHTYDEHRRASTLYNLQTGVGSWNIGTSMYELTASNHLRCASVSAGREMWIVEKSFVAKSTRRCRDRRLCSFVLTPSAVKRYPSVWVCCHRIAFAWTPKKIFWTNYHGCGISHELRSSHIFLWVLFSSLASWTKEPLGMSVLTLVGCHWKVSKGRTHRMWFAL